MLLHRRWIAAIAVAVGLTVSAFAAAAAPAGRIEIAESLVDFGQIEQSGGSVEATVTVRNIGDGTLVLNRLSTSCGCTSARMDLSPMAPGEARELIIAFDPMVHPDQTGSITRAVYLQTSDPSQPEAVIDVVGTVVAEPIVKVFFNEACQDCGELVKEMYPALFGEYGYTLELHDYINERSNRALLSQTNDSWGVPFELQSHIEAFVGNRLLIGGHVPEATIRYLLEHPDAYDRLLVYQDAMHGEETQYRVWDFRGEVRTFGIDEPITTYLGEEKGEGEGKRSKEVEKWGGMFAVVTISAFLDGLNPCAFAVLLFFIAFLFTMKKTRANIWKMGLVYIAAIYLAYLLIGLGIAQAIIISGAPHLMAKIGAYLVIGLGVIQLLGVLFPTFPIHLRIPIDTKATLEKWMYKATLPASFIGGFLVGLCTFPCSGGIYVAIIGMLSAQSSAVQGTFWMLWYNLIFVSPLLILLALSGNPKATEHLQKLERAEARNTRILIGGFMIALGVIILIFFT